MRGLRRPPLTATGVNCPPIAFAAMRCGGSIDDDCFSRKRQYAFDKVRRSVARTVARAVMYCGKRGCRMLDFLALLIGIVAGLRAMTAPAAVSWGAALGWLPVSETWAAFMGYRFTPWIFSLLALVEFVTDQLPSTPSRKVPQQFGARIVSGAFCGAVIGTAGGSPDRRADRRRDRRRARHARRLRGAQAACGGDRRQGQADRAFSRTRWRSSSASPRLRRRHEHGVTTPSSSAAARPGRRSPSASPAAGMRVAMIERKYLGGTCVNTGCKPTKTMVASAYAARMARRAADYGVVLEGDVGIDMKRVKARKDKVTLDSRNGLRDWLAGTPNITFVEGHARFRSPDRDRGQWRPPDRRQDLRQCRRPRRRARSAGRDAISTT